MELPLPQRLALVLERLGQTYVKARQLLATRTDHLPPAYAAAAGMVAGALATRVLTRGQGGHQSDSGLT